MKRKLGYILTFLAGGALVGLSIWAYGVLREDQTPTDKNRQRLVDLKKMRDRQEKGLRQLRGTTDDMSALMKAFEKDARKQMGDEAIDQFEQMRKRMEEMFEHSMKDMDMSFDFDHRPFGRDFSDNFGNRQVDQLTMKEEDDSIIYELGLENIDEESLEINIDNGQISISGQSRMEKTEDSGDFYGKTSMISSFSRSFPIPPGVEESEVEIEKVEKKLQIRFPKRKI